MKYLFLFFHSWPVNVSISKVGLLDCMWWQIFFIHSPILCLLSAEFKPFISEVVGVRKGPYIAILFVGFCISYSYFVLFLSLVPSLCVLLGFFVMTYFDSFFIFFCMTSIGVSLVVTMQIMQNVF